jgi:hypothetical protein
MVERYKFLPHISSFLSNIFSLFSEKGQRKEAGAWKKGSDEQREKLCGRALFGEDRFLLKTMRKVMRQMGKVIRQTTTTLLIFLPLCEKDDDTQLCRHLSPRTVASFLRSSGTEQRSIHEPSMQDRTRAKQGRNERAPSIKR